jgi:hypothetical protein
MTDQELKMHPKPRETSAPTNSLIAKKLPNAYFHDTWSLDLAPTQRSALELFIQAVEKTPQWIDRCMQLRNRAVTLLGLKNLGGLAAVNADKPANTYQVGERVGIFTLFENTFDEVILGDQDKHLDVFVGIQRRELPNHQVMLSVTTVVHVHNWLGRLYMLPVKSMHRIIAPAVLSRVG